MTAPAFSRLAPPDEPMRCDHALVKDMLIRQWKNLAPSAIDATGYVKRDIALLIECNYGIHHTLMENYLSNLERTLPQSV